MSFYQKLTKIGKRLVGLPKIMKWGFNLSPMYRRSTARITFVSSDMLHIKIKLAISYKNRNYMGTIFGGSMFSAVDPIPMIQLVGLLGEDYVVWDKSAEIFFKRPGNTNLYAEFNYSQDEVEEIKEKIKTENEIQIVKSTFLTNKDQTIIFCEVKKTIYVASKSFYKQKQALKKSLRDK